MSHPIDLTATERYGWKVMNSEGQIVDDDTFTDKWGTGICYAKREGTDFFPAKEEEHMPQICMLFRWIILHGTWLNVKSYTYQSPLVCICVICCC